jgi:superfamily II DNA or RNA helicase/intein/homing endonuclease
VSELKFNLRWYQKKACRAAVDAFEKEFIRRAMIVLGTGAGKTIAFSFLAWYFKRKNLRTLIIADSDELVDQAVKKLIKSCSIYAAVEKANKYANLEAMVVVGCAQSLWNEERLQRFPKDHFGLVVADECFVAGTLVDGIPIENLKPGDIVTGFCHKTKKTVLSKITAIKKSKPSSLVSVETKNGIKITCTPNHPFFANDSYKDCLEMAIGDRLVSINENKSAENLPRMQNGVSRVYRNLLKNLSKNKTSKKISYSREGVRDVREYSYSNETNSAHVCERKEGLLLQEMRINGDSKIKQGMRSISSIQSKVCERTDEEKQSDASAGNKIENGEYLKKNRPSTINSRWKRNWIDECGKDSFTRIKLQNEPDYKNRHEDGKRISNELQNRHGLRERKNWNRGRRRKSFSDTSPKSGREENKIYGIDWLENIEVHKSTSDGKFGGVCSDGCVYNIEVEGVNNYFANGILVHNCHLSLSAGWQRVLNHFDAYILGVTATPARGDNRPLLSFYEKIVFEYNLFDLIRDNFLSPITVQTVPIKVDVSNLRKTRKTKDGKPGDFSADQIDETLTPHFDEIIEAIKKHAPKRKILVFQPLIKTSLAFVARCNEHGLSARHVDGESKNRSEILQAYHEGEFQLLSNSMMLTKGYDEPAIDCIVNLRLTSNPTLYQQIVGRGTRLFCPHGCEQKCDHADAKKDLLLFDLLYQFEKYSIMRPGNLVAKTDLEAEKINAIALKANYKPRPLTEIAEEGLKDVEIELKRVLERRSFAKEKSYSALQWAQSVDFDALMKVDDNREKPLLDLTPRQNAMLKRNGIDFRVLRDKRHAMQVLQNIYYRYKNKLATIRQIMRLKQFRIRDAEKLTMDEASRILDQEFRREKMAKIDHPAQNTSNRGSFYPSGFGKYNG